ncbi:serine/threonine protein kinase [Nocardioides koreensis]|uniref:Serine/threonine protein kinase n=1 Tax=Nocardioides koreensis TaxID=433651 RepID=A0ABP5M0V5_9ACTN
MSERDLARPFPVPDAPVRLEPWLASVGTVFAEIRGHDSGCTSYGVQVDGVRWFVKAAYGADRAQLAGARRVHAVLSHPAVVPLVAAFALADEGHAVVHPWVDGEILNDPFAPGALPHAAPSSALNRFRALPLAQVLAAYDVVLDAHLAVREAGLVAVDFYDGCLIHDFDTGTTRLVDLDLYAPPYVLDVDRQFGSSRFMAPEEWRRGADVDARTTVFTLGRTGFQLLCGPGGDEATFRGDDRRRHVLERATAHDPAERFADVDDLVAAWRG